MTTFKDDLDKAQFYLKKIAAYTFIRHDSNYDYFLKELEKRGGLFKMYWYYDLGMFSYFKKYQMDLSMIHFIK